MPVALPCSLTQTADGRDLYVPQSNVSEPTGEVVYYNQTQSASTQQGALIDFSLTSPAPGVPLPNSPIGTGRKFPVGTYLVKLSCRNVDSNNGFTRTSFVIAWDGLQLFGGGASLLATGGAGGTSFGINVNAGGSGNFNILSWNGYNMTNPSQLQCEIVLLSQDQGTQFASGT